MAETEFAASHPTSRSVVRGLPRYEPGRDAEESRRRLGLDRVVKLASNESPYGPSPLALDAAKSALQRLHEYPDAGAVALRSEIARANGVSSDAVTVGNGSVELIDNIAKAFLDPGDEAVMAAPSFLKFRISTLVAGGVPVSVSLEDGRVDLGRFLDAIGPKTRVIYLACPDNPTGALASAAEISEFVTAVPRRVMIHLDLAYYEYAKEQLPDPVPFIERGNVFISRSFSKAHGLAGLRVGYGLGAPELIREVERVREHFNVNRIAQAAALGSLRDEEHLERAVRLNAACREGLRAELLDFGFRVHGQGTNFLLVGPPSGDGSRFASDLFDRGVIVRPLDFYGIADAVRVSVGREEDNAALLEAIRSMR